MNNNLTVIDNGQIKTYLLDDRHTWEVGRQSGTNRPDICMHSPTISRRHGKFVNTDGYWFYVDYNGKNGTFYNGRHIECGMNGRTKPIMLSDGDIFIFGGGKEAVVNHKTVWARFSNYYYGDRWNITETKGKNIIELVDGVNITTLNRPDKGTIVEHDKGIAIYMGDITYLAGSMSILERNE